MLSHGKARLSTCPQVLARGRESRTPPVDFCNQNDPRPQPPDQPNPARGVLGCPKALRSFGGWLRSLRSAANREFTGQGLVWAFALASSLRLDRSRGRLRPNPISSDTSCRKLAAAHDWSHHQQRSDRQANTVTSSPSGPSLRVVHRAASCIPPRRKTQYAAPEVPSIAG